MISFKEANYALTQLGQVQVVLQMLSEGKITMALSVHKNVSEAELANAAKIGAVVVGIFSVLVAPATGGASLAFAAGLLGAALGASAAALEEDWVGVAVSITASAFAFKGYTPTSPIQGELYKQGNQFARGLGDEGAQFVVGSSLGLGTQQVDDAVTGKVSSTLSDIFRPPPTVMEQILRDGLGDKAFNKGANFLNPAEEIKNFDKYGAIIETK